MSSRRIEFPRRAPSLSPSSVRSLAGSLSVAFLLVSCGRGSDAREAGPETTCKCAPVSKALLESRFESTPRRYAECGGFREDLNLIRNRRKIQEEERLARSKERSPVSTTNRNVDAPAASDKTGSAHGKSPTDVLTNVQEAGIDEPDLYKVSKDHVLALVNGDLHSADRTSSRAFDPVDLGAKVGAKMFVHGERLLVLDVVSKFENGAWKGDETRIRALRLPTGATPVVAQEARIPGAGLHARLTQGKLVVVATSFLGDKELASFRDDVQGVACDNVHPPAFHNVSEAFTSVSLLDAADLDAPRASKGFLGSGDFLYMSAKAVYVGSVASAWHTIISRTGKQETLGLERESLFVHRVPFDPRGGLGDASLGSVPGRAKDVWAFKETGPNGEHLAVATTTGLLWGKGKDAAENHLTILAKEGARLVPAGKVSGFGRNEDIRSVRYVGTMAWVVTFKKTDPLFAIDISDPRAPRIEGELKIPGFSTYLHPVREGRMVGLGFDASDEGDFALYQGIQFSLFDVSNPKSPKRLDVKTHGQRGSSSEATADHHAFFHDPDAGLVGFPLVELKAPAGSRRGEAYTGAVFYDVTGDSLKEVARVSHAEWIASECRTRMGWGSWWESPQKALDVARIFRAGGEILTVSPYGLRTWAKGLTEQATRETRWNPKGCPGDSVAVRTPGWGGIAVD